MNRLSLSLSPPTEHTHTHSNRIALYIHFIILLTARLTLRINLQSIISYEISACTLALMLLPLFFLQVGN